MSDDQLNSDFGSFLPDGEAEYGVVRRELEEIAPGLAGLIEGNIIAGTNGSSGLTDPSILAYVVHGSENESTEGVTESVSPLGINIYVVNETESGTPVSMDIISGHSAIIKTGTRNVIVPLHAAHSSDSVIVKIHQTTPATRLPTTADDSECQYRCPICFRDVKELESLRANLCGHICCGSCLKTAMEIRPHCPICGNPGDFSESINLLF
ncbi:uncharacterized protein LOC111066641 isoform X4 [Drosophila obscura]|uniref:uncharacterized protein LOC111066641 isoform X4 n=1 Tax=Drosophila obscura TaxID=7282 RepID=UPI000BA0D0BE|nr:uncharacterized protein LOC111066641 isoform X4 [Drosophila obscura]